MFLFINWFKLAFTASSGHIYKCLLFNFLRTIKFIAHYQNTEHLEFACIHLHIFRRHFLILMKINEFAICVGTQITQSTYSKMYRPNNDSHTETISEV